MLHAIQSLPFLFTIALMATACTGDDSSDSKSDSGVLGGDGDGDGDGDRQCDLTGTYGVVLTQRAGNCGPVATPVMLTVPESTSGVVMHTEMQFDRNLVTSIVNKGCSLRLTHEVTTSSGLLESRLDAGDLQLVSEGQLQGQAIVQRYAPTLPQTVACEGIYEMTMSLMP
jgi:hypothetical protein